MWLFLENAQIDPLRLEECNDLQGRGTLYHGTGRVESDERPLHFERPEGEGAFAGRRGIL